MRRSAIFSFLFAATVAVAGVAGCGPMMEEQPCDDEDGVCLSGDEIDPEADPDVATGKGDGASTVPTAVVTAAKKNMKRVAQDLDAVHLFSYGFKGTVDQKFYAALRKEFVNQEPDLYVRKMQVLASIAFIKRPDLLPPTGGRVTPFHGLDEAAYGRLMSIEDATFSQLVQLNGGALKGVRPFSVCETKYMIEKYVKPGQTVSYWDATSWSTYKTGYATWAKSCTVTDKAEWYNFRGLGKLRPTWLESNVMDRFTRKYADQCRSTTDTSAVCEAYRADRLAFRDGKNTELARRMFVYAPDQEAWLADPNNPLVVIPDQNGDGVGEIITPAATYVDSTGKTQNVTITSTSEFAGRMSASVAKIKAITAVDSRFKATTDNARADFGLLRIFSSAAGCDTASPSPTTCALLKRFWVMIDRHENFYQTYTSLSTSTTTVGKQPSPLVACSVTLAAADQWARMSPAGTDGFVFVMRVPYKSILAAGATTQATGEKPAVTTIRDLYTAGAALDFSTLWVDVASLSSNLYSNEHEISKYGYVRSEQIEGMIYVGNPADVL
jgi:hypothetical protein